MCGCELKKDSAASEPRSVKGGRGFVVLKGNNEGKSFTVQSYKWHTWSTTLCAKKNGLRLEYIYRCIGMGDRLSVRVWKEKDWKITGKVIWERGRQINLRDCA